MKNKKLIRMEINLRTRIKMINHVKTKTRQKKKIKIKFNTKLMNHTSTFHKKIIQRNFCKIFINLLVKNNIIFNLKLVISQL